MSCGNQITPEAVTVPVFADTPAYLDGHCAWTDGLFRNANPYPAEGGARSDWFAGWDAASNEGK